MKKLLSTFAFSLLALPGMAQLNFNVQAPANLSFVTITTDGVNMRKTPSPQGAKLLIADNEGCYDCPPDYVWNNGSAAHRRLETAHPNKGEVLKKLGTSGEWNKLDFSGTQVYTMAKFCSDITPHDIVDSDMKDPESVTPVPGCPGYYFYPYENEVVGICDLYIGKKAGNIIVFDRHVPLPIYNEEETYALRSKKIEGTDNEYYIYCNKSMCNVKKEKFEYEGGVSVNEIVRFDTQKLNQKLLTFLLKYVKTDDTPFYGVCTTPGAYEIVGFNL